MFTHAYQDEEAKSPVSSAGLDRITIKGRESERVSVRERVREGARECNGERESEWLKRAFQKASFLLQTE